MKFSVIGDTYDIDKNYLQKVAKAAFSFLPKTDGEIEFHFVSKEDIQDLNFQYRGKDNPTDVLSFNISERPLIGQIFVCYNIAVEQAENFGQSVKDEVSLLVTHGILHIFGYDHEEESDYQKMKGMEAQILANL